MGQNWLRALDARLQGMSRGTILGLALVIAIAIGIGDYFIETDILVLYLLPLFLAGWYGGPRAGYVVAIYASAASFVTVTAIERSLEFNTKAALDLIIRLATYLLIAQVFARLHESRRQQQELIGFIIHDLRSPVASAITGLATLQQSEERLSEEDRELVELALVSNQRALTLINSILDVAKLESGKMEVEIEEVEIESFVDECVSHVALWAQGHDIDVEKDLRLEKAALDPELTSRVLTNLLSNALKFSPPNSTVTILAEPEHEGVRFTVVDRGPGIPHDQAEAIFEPFSQVKGTQGGTGLGLTFCRLAVSAQGGKIGVKSHVGEGTSFWFTIPKHHHHA